MYNINNTNNNYIISYVCVYVFIVKLDFLL